MHVQAGDSPLQMGPKAEDSSASNTNPISFLFNFTMGTLAGGYYFVYVSIHTQMLTCQSETCELCMCVLCLSYLTL